MHLHVLFSFYRDAFSLRFIYNFVSYCRVAAALENSHLLAVVNKCIANTDKIEDGLSKLLASEL